MVTIVILLGLNYNQLTRTNYKDLFVIEKIF